MRQADTSIALQASPHYVWITDALYVTEPEALTPLLDELQSMGYSIEDNRDEAKQTRAGRTVIPREEMEQEITPLWFAKLPDMQQGKCGSCGQYISVWGIRSHGHRCEHCGTITYLEIQDGSTVEWYFKTTDSMPRRLYMKAYKWDAEQGLLYLYPETESSRWLALTGEKAQEYLQYHSDKWHVEEHDGHSLLVAKYRSYAQRKADNDTEVSDEIEVMDISSHFINHSIVKLWQGQEYSEWGDLPMPKYLSIYEAWHWSPLAPSPTLHQEVLHAAGQVSDQGYYYQDRRQAFYPLHWQRMRSFVEHFTTIPVEQWDAHSFRQDGPGGIADLAHFCSGSTSPQIINRPNIMNTITAFGKALGGQPITQQEVEAAAAGLADLLKQQEKRKD